MVHPKWSGVHCRDMQTYPTPLADANLLRVPLADAGARWLWAACLLLCLAWSGLARGAAIAPVTVDAGTSMLPLGALVEWREDPSGQLGFSDVAAPGGNVAFQPSQHAVPNFGFTRSAYWFRIRLTNHDAHQRDWLLENQYPLLDHVDLYLRTPDGQLKVIRGGRALPYTSRAVDHPNLVFRLPLARDAPTELYLRVQTGGSLQLPLRLWRPDAFAASDRSELFLLAAFYGLLAAMFCYNLLLFLSLRDASYFYYVLYVASFSLFQFSLNGLAFEYLWPASPRWAALSVPFFLSLSLVAIIQFSCSFLHIGQYLPTLKRVLAGLQLAMLGVAAACAVADYSLLIRITTLVGLIISMVIFVAGGHIWRNRGLEQARYFIIAWTSLLGGMLLYALKTVNAVPTTFVTSYGLQIGAGLEVLLLSFALAHRLKILKAENERIQREQTEELERKVEQRTMQLDQAMHQLVATNKELEAFSYTVSHDLRAPLRAIDGFSQALDEQCANKLTADERGYLLRIRNASRRMFELIDALLGLARINRLELKTEQLDLSALASEVWAELEGQYADHPRELVAAPDVYARADRQLMRNVLNNLLGNALKFSARQPLSRVEFGAGQRDGRTVYFVRDNGAGFDPRFAGKLFGAFQRFHDQREFEGTGIGLASVQRIIHRHGGEIWAESSPGAGACFYFTLAA